MNLMSTDINKLNDELKELKRQVNVLFDELRNLKENYQSLGYNSEDSILSEEEKKELEKIRSDIKTGDYNNLTELDWWLIKYSYQAKLEDF